MVKKEKFKTGARKIDNLFKRTPWLLALGGAILAIIGLFTPIATMNYFGVDVYRWLGGIIYATEDYGGGWWGGGVEKGFHAVGDDLIGIFTLVINSVAAAYLLMYSSLSKRGKDFRWAWLVYLITGLAMIFTTSLWLVDVKELIADAKLIGFGIIAPFIAGMLAIIACVYERIGRK